MFQGFDINAANTKQYPYWQPSHYQPPTVMVGRSIDTMIQDVMINRIPGQSDFNEADINTIPTPNAPNNDITSAELLQTHNADLGRGAGFGLIDLFYQTQDEINTLAGNR